MPFFQGDIVEKDYIKAMKWFKVAAYSGHAEAQLNVGVMYFKGFGVKVSLIKAKKWFLKAASRGSIKAVELVEYIDTII